MMSEICEAVELGLKALGFTHKDDLPENGELEQKITDAIANLLTIAHRAKLNVGDVVRDGAAHWIAMYIDDMDQSEAEDFVADALFPFTGSRQYAEYIADQAMVFGGHKKFYPGWGE